MKTIPATYENGVFKPQSRVELSEGAEVQVILPPVQSPSERMAQRYPLSWGAMSKEDAEEMERLIEEECERIDDEDPPLFD